MKFGEVGLAGSLADPTFLPSAADVFEASAALVRNASATWLLPVSLELAMCTGLLGSCPNSREGEVVEHNPQSHQRCAVYEGSVLRPSTEQPERRTASMYRGAIARMAAEWPERSEATIARKSAEWPERSEATIARKQ